MRILITGSRGQVGQHLRQNFPEDWEMIATDSKTLDITQIDNIERMISGFQPDVLINTSGFTDVNSAEQNIEKAFAINANGCKNLAVVAQKHHVRMIHLSTDYVFDGNKHAPYDENDAPNPLNVYGQSKLAGEVLALAHNENTLIIRTSAVFGEHGNNFVKSIHQQAQNNQPIEVVADQVCNPTYAMDLANAIITLVRDYPEMRGLFHFVGNTSLTWFDFAQRILKAMQKDTSILQKTTSTDTTIKRPTYSVLNSIHSLDIKKHSLDEAILKSIEFTN